MFCRENAINTWSGFTSDYGSVLNRPQNDTQKITCESSGTGAPLITERKDGFIRWLWGGFMNHLPSD